MHTGSYLSLLYLFKKIASRIFPDKQLRFSLLLFIFSSFGRGAAANHEKFTSLPPPMLMNLLAQSSQGVWTVQIVTFYTTHMATQPMHDERPPSRPSTLSSQCSLGLGGGTVIFEGLFFGKGLAGSVACKHPTCLMVFLSGSLSPGMGGCTMQSSDHCEAQQRQRGLPVLKCKPFLPSPSSPRAVWESCQRKVKIKISPHSAPGVGSD